MPDGTKPVPGGWNRVIFEIEDIEATVTRLKGNGMKFKNEIIRGGGRAQILCEDHVRKCYRTYATKKCLIFLGEG